MTIHIREIAAMTIQQVIDKYNETSGEYEVQFDDGLLPHFGAEIVFTRFILNYWNNLPKDFQLLKRYSIAHDRKIDPHTALALCSRIYADYVNEYEGTEWDIDDEHMNRVVYKEVVNALYNFHVEYLISYTRGASALDLIEIMRHPPIRAANDRIQKQKHEPTPEEIAAVHEVINTEMLTSPLLRDNAFSVGGKCKALKMMQMTMVVGPVGNCTDIDSSLFPHALRWGYFEGHAQMWEMGIESRNASIASLFNDLIMPEAQYANRRYQLVAHSVRWVVREDCGTTSYKRTHIVDAKMLRRMTGIWYMPDDGKLRCIQGNEKHLVGTTIRQRAISHCTWSRSRSEVCSVCYGRLYRAAMKTPRGVQTNIKGRNIGHLAGITLGGKGSSVVLSRKHANATSIAASFELTFEQQAYMQVSKDGRSLMFHEQFRPLNTIKIKLYRSQVEKLYDIRSGVTPMVAPSSLTFVESFNIIDMNLEDGHNVMSTILGSKQRAGHLSIDALKYIVNKGWEFDDRRDLIIDLSEWDRNKPFFSIPQIELSPPEFIEAMTRFMLGPTDKKNPDVILRRLDSYPNIDDATDALYHEIAEYIDVHFTHISVLVLALSAQDPENDDYRLPYPRNSGTIVTETPLLFNNSAGMQMAYEQQHKILSTPQSFVLHKRRGHPLDGLLLSKVYGNRKDVQS